MSEDFKTQDLQNLEKIKLNRATMQRASTHDHKFTMTSGLFFQICANLFIISQNWPYTGLLRP